MKKILFLMVGLLGLAGLLFSSGCMKRSAKSPGAKKPAATGTEVSGRNYKEGLSDHSRQNFAGKLPSYPSSEGKRKGYLEREKRRSYPYTPPSRGFTPTTVPSQIPQPDGRGPEQGNSEQYTHYGFQPFKDPQKDSLSTFSIDVDSASYTIARKKIESGILPPPASVRPEEFINYFQYRYPGPQKGPFGAAIDGAPSPFRKGLYVVRVGIQGKILAAHERKPANLVFLIDTSGSMNRWDKIDLIKKSLALLVKGLRPEDRIGICTYAGNASVALEPTSGRDKGRILEALGNLRASGSTRMGQGVLMAYNYAMRTYMKGGINRVIVCSDGDANVGPRSHGEMLKTIGEYQKEGITLSTIGFGMGNYKDTMMEQLANKGNGNYYYVDKLSEAKRIFVDQIQGTLQVIAYDTKIQVEFNPQKVKKFRLIGYENRKIAHKDFRNDQVDAGEVGAGHSVTALYEVSLKDGVLKSLEGAKTKEDRDSLLSNFLVLRLRYKEEADSKSKELSFSFQNFYSHFEEAPQNFRLAAVVGETAEVLRKSPYAKSNLSFVLEMARTAVSSSEIERDFISLLEKAVRLMG